MATIISNSSRNGHNDNHIEGRLQQWQKIEKGYPGCAIGLFFEIAVLVGLKLFDSEVSLLAKYLAQTDDKLAVLPKKTSSNSRYR